MQQKFWRITVLAGMFVLIGFPAWAFEVLHPKFAPEGELLPGIQFAYNAQFEQAESFFNNAISRYPDDPMPYVLLGTTFDWKQKVRGMEGGLNNKILQLYKQAEDMAYQQWHFDSTNIDKMIHLGNAYLFRSKKEIDVGNAVGSGLILKKAKKHLLEALEKDPNRYDAYLALGAFHYFAANIPPGLKFIASLLGIKGDRQQGLRELDTAASHTHLFHADALWLTKYIYDTKEHNAAQSLKYQHQIQEKYPDNPHFVYEEAMIHINDGNYNNNQAAYPEADKQFDRLLAYCEQKGQGYCHNQYYFWAYWGKGFAAFKADNFEGVMKFSDEALKRTSPAYPYKEAELYLWRGRMLAKKGDRAAAKAEFNKIQRLQKNHPEAWAEAKAYLNS